MRPLSLVRFSNVRLAVHCHNYLITSSVRKESDVRLRRLPISTMAFAGLVLALAG
jgi:CRISPR/Cas system-associated endonuclease Cas3-HD